MIIISFLAVGLVMAQDEEKAEKSIINKDAGTVTAEGYTNSTYGIDLKLPQDDGKWTVIKNEKLARVQTNGKVAELWNVGKDVRVVMSIQERGARLQLLAEENVASLALSFRKLKVIVDKNYLRKGPHFVSYQELEAQDIAGGKYKVQNYIIMKKEDNKVKINFFIISPLNNYFQDRFYLANIYKSLEIK